MHRVPRFLHRFLRVWPGVGKRSAGEDRATVSALRLRQSGGAFPLFLQRALHALRVALSIGGGFLVIVVLADAQVISPAGPHQATVLSTSNGVPYVNIQTPNAKGVSVNQYSQFDISSAGVILNNSR